MVVTSPAKLVYRFGGGLSEGYSLGNATNMTNVLGGKGKSLQDYAQQGLNVPPGFTITAEVGANWLKEGRVPPELAAQIIEGMAHTEAVTGRNFGSSEDPLLVSVRSGGRVSMPGMMDTVLNLGLNEETAEGLARMFNDRQFAFDSYRRFVESFGKVVLEIEGKLFRAQLDLVKRDEGLEIHPDTDGKLRTEAIESQLLPAFFELVAGQGNQFPQTPQEQLDQAIEAVFKSWTSDKAVAYRASRPEIKDDWGTAVNVQAMVYGNLPDSGTGVMMTRNDSNGHHTPEVSFRERGQGEEVVSGSHSTMYLSQFKRVMPAAAAEVVRVGKEQEALGRDMQDMEFTVEKGIVWWLQKRVGKRTARAAIKIAVDMANEGLITKEEAVLRISPEQLLQLLAAQVDPDADVEIIGKAAAASLGAVSGQLVFNSKDSIALAAQGGKPILTRVETSTDDYPGMAPAAGILTQEGSEGCHAAIVCKSEGKVGLFSLNGTVDEANEQVILNDGTILKKGDTVTLDANNKILIRGEAPLVPPKGLTPAAKTLLSWADKFARLKVRTNADTPAQMEYAKNLGAKGVGLKRIEHWIQEDAELRKLFKEYILLKSPQAKERRLLAIRRKLKRNIKDELRIMKGKPFVIRLLDPPIHEFLPRPEAIYEQLLSGRRTKRNLLDRVKQFGEANPMLGHRGVRLGITNPELTRMQAGAIYEAAAELIKEENLVVKPEIMIPVVSLKSEIDEQQPLIEEEYQKVLAQFGLTPRRLKGIVGTMIELPAAAIAADQLASVARFFSFGTNDLTQTTFGFSRDDVAKLLGLYREKGLIDRDPFQTLMPEVVTLMEMAIKLGRGVNPDLEIGICGEHGRDPESIRIAHRIGLDYVSPSREGVAVARLVAAQAALEDALAAEG